MGTRSRKKCQFITKHSLSFVPVDMARLKGEPGRTRHEHKDENTEETKSSETTAASAATTATGDNFRPGLWVILVGVACLALAALFLFKKKA